ncbi:MAG: histidine triad nucleotide-binding protein [Eggerthellaceae bacterium]|jgi:histidine triad (HIT) family protein|uniref:histidine triad nucleotide-binding protein n=1 Tax=Denitrobacterium detoxificans TaxID=79604 RepID=UPI0026E9C19C|nr:histidine triad nucleotide-binding protein [Denitrobacterium detoxificans]MBE6465984.1 histidine triad nucleotide-binding protein [Denitrobacterium detoxificans]MCR5583268.1 histidine triad nucleotide-binding protein [Eggerthellaceae bacterium]
MHDENCIFCKIAKGEIPTSVVYEDDKVIAFDDMEPLMPVHTLIIPKDHYSDVADNVPEDVLGHLFATVQKVADIKGIHEDGFRLLVNTGENASQSVRHLHVHVLGGGLMPRPNDQDWGTAATNAAEIHGSSAE